MAIRQTSSRQPGQSGRADRRDVLLVEDSPADAEYIAEVLSPGYAVQNVETLAEARTALAVGRYDLVLLDLNLPDSSGLKTLERLVDGNPLPPVVVLTGFGDADLGAMALKMGAQDFIDKSQIEDTALARSSRHAIERHRLLASLSHTRRLQQSTLDALSSHIALLDEDGTIVMVNLAWERWAEDTGGDFPYAPFGTSYPAACTERGGAPGRAIARGIRQVMGGRRQAFEHEFRCPRHDEDTEDRWCFVRVTHAPDPEQPRVVVAHTDVTRRRALEDQLRHAQKMDAIGRLAGGVAHDFNNLLHVILGFSGRAIRRLAQGDDADIERDLRMVHGAGTRAAALTQQLLAFSRKQVFRPQILDAGAVASDLQPMLQRILPQGIELTLDLDPAAWRVEADRGQLEQVLLNLGINARDAMASDGDGSLRIAVHNETLSEDDAARPAELPPGDYVALKVADTGRGIPEDALPRIFEPFFTTKGPGKGTGLGLSTAYGIVRQSGGHIAVENASGGGAVFTIRLPRSRGERLGDASEPDAQAPRHGRETVLLVEDDDAVRELMSILLEETGYTVLALPGPEEAIAVARERQGPIDLLVTDVVMPGLGGGELAAEILRLRPDTKVLYVSATAATGRLPGRGGPRGPILQKPFTFEALHDALRMTLNGVDPETRMRARRTRAAGRTRRQTNREASSGPDAPGAPPQRQRRRRGPDDSDGDGA